MRILCRYKKVIIFSLGIFTLITLSSHNYLSEVLWEKFHSPSLALLLPPNDPKTLFELGNYYFNGGAYDINQAKIIYEKIIEIDPTYPGAHYQLARINFLKGDSDTARELISGEIKLNPDFKRSYYVRGLVNAYATGHLTEAEKDFNSFLKSDPQSWAALNDLAFVYWKMGRYDKMEATAEEGLKYNPGNVWLLMTQMNALLNLQKDQEALEKGVLVESALENLTETTWQKAYPGHNPQSAFLGIQQMKSVVQFNLGILYERQHMPEEAIKSYEKFLSLDASTKATDHLGVEVKIATLKKQYEENI